MISKTFSGFTSTAALPTTSGSDEVFEVTHRSAVGHGFQRRQAKTFVERRENEDLGGIVKNPQHFDGDETEEAHIILHSAADHGAAQVGMLGKLVADDDQLQVGNFSCFLQFRFQGGKSFDDPNQVLGRTDAARIKQKRILDEVAFRQDLAVGVGGMSMQEALVDGVVDHFNMRTRNAENVLDFTLGEIGDRKYSAGAFQHSARELEVQGTAQAGMRAWYGTCAPEDRAPS